MRGFSLLELMIAMTIGCAVIIAAAGAASGYQGGVARGSTRADLEVRARFLLETELRRADEDFALVFATTTDDGAYTRAVTTDLASDFLSKRVTASVMRDDGFSRVSYEARVPATDDPAVPDTCDATLAGTWSNMRVLNTGNEVDIAPENSVTGMAVSRGVVYMTADSSSTTVPDLYTIDVSDPAHPRLRGTLNTGPGAADVAVATSTAYLANMSATGQLQTIDIRDPWHPVLAATRKIAVDHGGVGNSVAYYRGRVYLGLTASGADDEFSRFDAQNPFALVRLPGVSIGSHAINAIRVRGGYAYLAIPDYATNLIILDVSGANVSPFVVRTWVSPYTSTFGERIALIGNILYLGTAEGLNDARQFYQLDVSHLSESMPLVGTPVAASSSVYGIVIRSNRAFIGTNTELQEWSLDDPMHPVKVASLPLGGRSVAMSCDGNVLYVAINGATQGRNVLKIIGPGA